MTRAMRKGLEGGVVKMKHSSDSSRIGNITRIIGFPRTFRIWYFVPGDEAMQNDMRQD
jgi:hypothetical protein